MRALGSGPGQQQRTARDDSRSRACAGLDTTTTMSEETPQPEVAAEGSSEPEISALEKEMNALLSTTQGAPQTPHAPSPRLRPATPGSPLE